MDWPLCSRSFTFEEDFALDLAVARSRLGYCGVMSNLPVARSAVNSKTLVQLKKICRGLTRSGADHGSS